MPEQNEPPKTGAQREGQDARSLTARKARSWACFDSLRSPFGPACGCYSRWSSAPAKQALPPSMAVRYKAPPARGYAPCAFNLHRCPDHNAPATPPGQCSRATGVLIQQFPESHPALYGPISTDHLPRPETARIHQPPVRWLTADRERSKTAPVHTSLSARPTYSLHKIRFLL